MPRMSRDRTWILIAAGAAAVAGIATRKALDASWRKVKKRPPPRYLESPDDAWPQVLAWSAVTGLLVGFSRLLARQGAAVGWKRITGRMPPLPLKK